MNDPIWRGTLDWYMNDLPIYADILKEVAENGIDLESLKADLEPVEPFSQTITVKDDE